MTIRTWLCPDCGHKKRIIAHTRSVKVKCSCGCLVLFSEEVEYASGSLQEVTKR